MLLLLLFYTQLGYYGQFLVLQWQLKEAAREAWIAALPDAALFRVSLGDVNAYGRWEEAGRECWFNNHLYDVIRQRTVGRKTWLFCLDDSSEEQLIRRSGEFSHAGQDQPGKKTTHLLSIRIEEAVFDTVTPRIDRPSRLCLVYSLNRVSPLPTRYSEITIPPPKG